MPAAAPRPPLRLARALVLAGVVLTLAGAGHALAGGQVTPSGAGLALAALLAVALPLTATEVAAPTLVLVLGAGQVLTHLLLGGLPASVPGHTAHLGGPALVRSLGGTCGAGLAEPMAMAGHSHPGTGTPLVMWLAHAAATLAATWWLRNAERRVWLLLRRGLLAAALLTHRLVAAVLDRLARPARTDAPQLRRTGVPTVPPALRGRPLAGVPARRGPPAARALA